MPSPAAENNQAHEPVLLKEVVYWLQPHQGGLFVDCTLGLGGHTEALLQSSPEAKVIGIDQDFEALQMAQKRLAGFKERFEAVHANFSNLSTILADMNIPEANGILADLGVSSMQLERSERGFSFLTDVALDMRMDRSRDRTAADLVNELGEKELADLIFQYGEERGARKIARLIIKEREKQPITTTKQLADLVVRALNIPGRWRIHPATRTFQALRIAVNDELNILTKFIPSAVSKLAGGGRLAVISFHSLEDRIVKRSFQLEAGRCICDAKLGPGKQANRHRANLNLPPAVERKRSSGGIICDRCGASERVRILTRKPVRPGDEEVERNPRSRSALLRVCEKL